MGTESKDEKRTLEKIIEQIGPFGLIAVCVTLLVNVASRPLDVNSWVSIGIILMIIGMSFFVDWLRMKNSTAIEQLRIKSKLEFDRHKVWVEENRPLVEGSSSRGRQRMDYTKALLAVRRLLEQDLKEGEITSEQQTYCHNLIKRLTDIEKTVVTL